MYTHSPYTTYHTPPHTHTTSHTLAMLSPGVFSCTDVTYSTHPNTGILSLTSGLSQGTSTVDVAGGSPGMKGQSLYHC